METPEQRVRRMYRSFVSARRQRSAAKRLISLASSRLRKLLVAELQQQQKVDYAGNKFQAVLSNGFRSACISCHRLFHQNTLLKFEVSNFEQTFA
jgi:hypothetical protein